MSETTGSVNCPECGMEFDSQEELARHSRQIHAVVSAKTSRAAEIEESPIQN